MPWAPGPSEALGARQGLSPVSSPGKWRFVIPTRSQFHGILMGTPVPGPRMQEAVPYAPVIGHGRDSGTGSERRSLGLTLTTLAKGLRRRGPRELMIKVCPNRRSYGFAPGGWTSIDSVHLVYFQRRLLFLEPGSGRGCPVPAKSPLPWPPSWSLCPDAAGRLPPNSLCAWGGMSTRAGQLSQCSFPLAYPVLRPPNPPWGNSGGEKQIKDAVLRAGGGKDKVQRPACRSGEGHLAA